MLRIAHSLSGLQPSLEDAMRLKEAVRCLVFDICKSIGEAEAARILEGSWGGLVLKCMQEHHKSLTAEREAREEYQSPEGVRQRREEVKRSAQERHQQRLALKKERDKVWYRNRQDAGRL
jgi:hypothetical protein